MSDASCGAIRPTPVQIESQVVQEARCYREWGHAEKGESHAAVILDSDDRPMIVRWAV